MTAASPRTLALLAALVVAHLLATAWLTPHGHMNVDECTYHLMARGASQGTLAFWNGYGEFPTRELVWVTVVPYAGELYPVTPPFYAGIAWPFYRAFGFPGLFWMNALAFLVVLWLTARFAQQLFGDARLSLTAALVLGAATYFWEYSQAAWPHVLSTLAVLAAGYAGWHALRVEGEAAAWRASLLAGLALGVGTGVRLDVALAVPAVALPFLFVGGRRGRAALGLVLGGLPPLALLTFMNYLKFGIASPLSYGPNVSSAGEWTRYVPVAGLGLALVLACWALQRPALLARFRRQRLQLIAVASLGLVAMLAVPAVRELLMHLAGGVTTLLVDLRGLRQEMVRPALSRSAGDGLVYFGHLKKAWLQSLPYLGLLLLPLGAALRGHPDRGRLALLALLPATYLAAFGYFAWDGGMSLNLRYLTPALPAVAILTAWALRAIEAERAPRALAAGAWVSAALFWWLARTRSASPDAMELFVLDTPLVIAGCTALAAVGWMAAGGERARSAAVAFGAAALVWAALVAFQYDYPAVRWLRDYNAGLSRIAGEKMRADSILFTTHPDPYCGLLDAEQVRVALPARDRYRDFRALVDFHLAQVRPVYAALPRDAWRMLERSGRLEGLTVEPLHEHPIFVLARLRD